MKQNLLQKIVQNIYLRFHLVNAIYLRFFELETSQSDTKFI